MDKYMTTNVENEPVRSLMIDYLQNKMGYGIIWRKVLTDNSLWIVPLDNSYVKKKRLLLR